MGLDIDFIVQITNSNEITRLYDLRVVEVGLYLGSYNSYMLKDYLFKHKDFEKEDEHTGQLCLSVEDMQELVHKFNDCNLTNIFMKYMDLKNKYEELGSVYSLFVRVSE